MTKTPDDFVKSYPKNSSFIDRYNNYQKRYDENIRESDRVLVDLVKGELEATGNEAGKVLDVGCSTGNFLKHLRKGLPEASLYGVDLADASIAVARDREDLEGVEFSVADASDLPFSGEFNVITTNAVTYPFDYELYGAIVKSIYDSLQPDGAFVAFEFFHEFLQDLKILEISNSHPDGIYLHFRPMEKVKRILESVGFREVEFHPFEIGIDLEKGAVHAGNEGGFEDLNSYTRKDEDGNRLLFRGTLFQPWCHLVARK